LARRNSGKAACTICAHEKRHQIEIGMVNRVSYRTLAKRFQVSRDAIYRHGRSHLPPQARAAILTALKGSAVDLEQLQRSESEGLLSQLVGQRARLQQYADLALEQSDVRTAVTVENAITGNLTLVAKLMGQLVQHHEVRSTSILISPDYIALRSAIVRALAPYPEAARAVGQALAELETAAANDITSAKAPLVIEYKDDTDDGA
jgi:hypothetical protein